MTEYTAQQIVDFLEAGEGPGSLFASGELAQQLAAKHVEARDMMARLQSAMSEAWAGDAAGQAQAGAGPPLAASEVSAVHLAAAQSSLMNQGSDYADLRNKVGSGPGPRPEEDFLSRHLPMLTHKDEEIAGWNAKAQEVVQHYGTYHGQSNDNASTLPRDYGELTLPSGGADVEHAEAGDHRVGAGRVTAVERRGLGQDTYWEQERTTTTSGQDTSGEQQRPGVGTITSSDWDTSRQPDRDTSGPGDVTQTSGLSAVGGGGTVRPGSVGPGLSGGGFAWAGDVGPGLSATDDPGGAGRSGGAGGFGPAGEPGAAGEGWRSGSGATGETSGSGAARGGRSGSGSANEPRGGRGEAGGRSGSGRLGQPGIPRPGGATGVSGKPGIGSIGGPLVRGGDKDEDEEHQRLEILQEPDPDELFGGFPDGMKPVSPTIGA